MVDFAFVFDQDGTLVRNRAFKYAYEKLPKVLGLDEERDVFPKIFLDTYYELVRARRFTDAFDWEKVSEFSCRRIGITYRRGLFLELILEGINKCLVDTNECAADVLRTIKKSGGAIGLITAPLIYLAPVYMPLLSIVLRGEANTFFMIVMLAGVLFSLSTTIIIVMSIAFGILVGHIASKISKESKKEEIHEITAK